MFCFIILISEMIFILFITMQSCVMSSGSLFHIAQGLNKHISEWNKDMIFVYVFCGAKVD